MTPLEAARKMAETCPTFEPEPGVVHCAVCYAYLPTHAPDCPWLAMPQIVAALEAAEHLTEAWQGSVDNFPMLEVLERVKGLAGTLKGNQP